MNITFTGQIHQSVSRGYTDLMSQLTVEINEALRDTGLSNVELEVSFCPIILPKTMAAAFPAKPKYVKSKKIYYLHKVIEYETYRESSMLEKRKILLLALEDVGQVLESIVPSSGFPMKYLDVLEKLRMT